MNIKLPLLHQKAQSTIELLFIAVLVMASIVFLGPYLIDAVRAHFKMWDTASHEALTDRLLQASKDQMDINSPPCACTIDVGACNVFGCVERKAIRKNCTPVGCEPMNDCSAPDPLCCSVPTPVDEPGCYYNGYLLNGAVWAQPNQITGIIRAQDFHVPCVDPGDRVYSATCGGLPTKVLFCKEDNYPSNGGSRPSTERDLNMNCYPGCQWGQKPANATKCDGAGTSIDGSQRNVQLVSFGQCGTDAATVCRAYCPSGTLPSTSPSGDLLCI